MPKQKSLKGLNNASNGALSSETTKQMMQEPEQPPQQNMLIPKSPPRDGISGHKPGQPPFKGGRELKEPENRLSTNTEPVPMVAATVLSATNSISSLFSSKPASMENDRSKITPDAGANNREKEGQQDNIPSSASSLQGAFSMIKKQLSGGISLSKSKPSTAGSVDEDLGQSVSRPSTSGSTASKSDWTSTLASKFGLAPATTTKSNVSTAAGNIDIDSGYPSSAGGGSEIDDGYPSSAGGSRGDRSNPSSAARKKRRGSKSASASASAPSTSDADRENSGTPVTPDGALAGVKLGELSKSTLEGLLTAAKGKADALKAEKKQAKQKLTAWIDEFAAKHGREPTDKDKEEEGLEVYAAYQKATASLKRLEFKINIIENQISNRTAQLMSIA